MKDLTSSPTPEQVPLFPLPTTNGSSGTCYPASQVPGILDQALRSMSWTTVTSHLYCLVLTRIDSRKHGAVLRVDERIDCELCGTERRDTEMEKSRKQFKPSGTVYLTLVKSTSEARHAVTKQIGDKGGTGWYVPIHNAYALISTVQILAKDSTPYSIDVPEAEREAVFAMLLEAWRADAGRMTRPGYRQDDGRRRRSGKPRVHLGTVNIRYGRHLEELSIPFVSREDAMEIFTRFSAPRHEQALTRSGWKPPGNDIDWEPPDEIQETEDEAEASSG